ncbi:MAG: DUF4173 domain-containing protein [Bacteroidetes bacterium]|nr:DUF4173 domain-containing protein [Bacteroidota bacterium]
MIKNLVIAFTLCAYCILFYLQLPGLNYFIFNLLLVLGIAITNTSCLKHAPWIAAAVGTVLGGLSVFLYGNQLSLYASIVSVAALAAYSFSETKTILLAIINSAYSFLCGWLFGLRIFFRNRFSASTKDKWHSSALLKIIVPSIVLLVFITLYLNANPILAKLFSQLNLDIISFQFFRFVLVGWAMLYGFYYYQRIETVTVYDAGCHSGLNRDTVTFTSWINNKLNIKAEINIGFITLLLLNLLLLLVNIVDVNYLFILKAIPADMTYSEYVHQGTNSLITSIVLAIAILLYYFRGCLNFEAEAIGLRVVSFAWIIQNVLLVYSTAYRNFLYIQEYSYTYKRIGVMLYLLVCVAGLALTLYKLVYKKSNWFLIRSCSWLMFGLLILFSFYNWDKFITTQNIEIATKQNRTLDKAYLLSLGYSNTPLLIAEAEKYQHKNKADRNYGSGVVRSNSISDDEYQQDYYDGFTHEHYTKKLSSKIAQLFTEQNKYGWQSSCIGKKSTISEILKLNEKHKISKLDFSHNAVSSLRDVALLSPDTLQLEYMQGLDMSLLPNIKNLKYLNLRGTKADTLNLMPALQEVRGLTLDECSIHNFSFLKNYPHIESLSARKNLINDCNSLAKVKQLRKVDLSFNMLINISALDSMTQLEELILFNAFAHYGCIFPQNSSLLKLDISNNDYIKNQDLKLNALTRLKELSANQLKLKSVKDLFKFDGAEKEIFHSLTTLQLNDNFISDLNSLVLFDKLQSLELANNNMVDIPTGLSSTIFNLKISDNAKLESISALADLKKLKTLDISSCPRIKSFVALQSLTSLETLDIGSCAINTMFPNMNLPALLELDLSYNPIDRLDSFSNSVNLKTLDIRGLMLSDVWQLGLFKYLTTLTFDQTFSAEHKEWVKKHMPQVQLDYVANNRYSPSL